MDLADVISIYQRYHFPLPAGLDQESVNTIMATTHRQWTTLYKSPAIASVAGSQLLKTIVEKLQIARQNNTELKYMLFSAHDTTLLAQMAVLEAPIEQWPAYASRLNFSLFADGNDNDIVTISYNNQPVFIPACKGFSCHLAELVQLADDKEKLAQSVLMD
jgi:hypothetical protein